MSRFNYPELGKSPNRTYLNVNDAWSYLYEYLCSYKDNDDMFNNDRESIVLESSPRGKKIRELIDCDITILNPIDNLVTNKCRGLSPNYLAKEYFWYKSGSRDPKYAPNSKFWQSIANEDDGLINSNYGAYIFAQKDSKYPELSVFDATVKLIKDDPDTRHAIIQIPIIPRRGSKDTPCTSSIHFILRENKLFATVYMRSCDIIAGFPYDMFQFTMWQIELANKLGVELGWFRFIAGSLHVYEEDFMSNRGIEHKMITDGVLCHYISIPFDSMSSNHSYDSIIEDLNVIIDKKYISEDDGSTILGNVFNNKQFKYMIDNKKIWKRDNW